MLNFLQAFAQVPDINIWYGPDSYMGANIKELLQQMTKMTDEEIAEIHPGHSRETIRSLLPRLHFYQVFFLFFSFLSIYSSILSSMSYFMVDHTREFIKIMG